jgi:hypothetical protein
LESEPHYTVIKGTPPTMTYPNRTKDMLEPGTYFVLRDTDVLATPLLYLYAHELRTQLDIARHRPGFMSKEGIAELEERERYVANLAAEWQRAGRGRLPA